MTTHREAIFVNGLWVEKDPFPEDIAKPIDEVGLTSAPMESMAFFFAQHCKDYTEDFMLCKNESSDQTKCLKEGRKVTRCAMDLISKLKANCDKQWEQHWKCMDTNNHLLWLCRPQEKEFNDCVFNKLGLTKHIPGVPEGETPVHLKENPMFKREPVPWK
ncbi:hypothetical protein HK097_010228 [Rhizophlyctis rosea]|uniref:NADH-ubiquinone oxidoreductase n=1 Tax=Rhizophlyctis rosea TaxID=64517 RepID=A0AAD5S7V7_9FUNG|nr:hypothetical protein HK097_010228 [Rhizophlyctis rosea]